MSPRPWPAFFSSIMALGFTGPDDAKKYRLLEACAHSSRQLAWWRGPALPNGLHGGHRWAPGFSS